jgi:serine/threonine-protein kinase
MTTELSSKPTGGLPRNLYGYEVIDFLGEGAGSIIYVVSDPVTAQLYALKQVVVKNEKEQRFVDQLLNEYEIGIKVRHPLLRRCIDLKVNKTLLRKVTDAGLVMEMVEGASCEARPPEDINTAVDIFRQTADALHALNQAGYVHCDLKPNNIMVSAEGAVKVIDLGQACPIGSVKTRIQGTPDFISPEQVKCEPVTVATDVYNLGATMYAILTGQKLPTLFTLKKGENSFLVADAIPQPHEINPAVPPNLSNLVMECCRVTPAKRPADMGELSRRLDIIHLTLTGGGSQQATVVVE